MGLSNYDLTICVAVLFAGLITLTAVMIYISYQVTKHNRIIEKRRKGYTWEKTGRKRFLCHFDEPVHCYSELAQAIRNLPDIQTARWVTPHMLAIELWSYNGRIKRELKHIDRFMMMNLGKGNPDEIRAETPAGSSQD